MQWKVGFSTEICDVDASSPTCDEYPIGLFRNTSYEVQVLVESHVLVILFLHIVRG
jgi:hypothetical protein